MQIKIVRSQKRFRPSLAIALCNMIHQVPASDNTKQGS